VPVFIDTLVGRLESRRLVGRLGSGVRVSASFHRYPRGSLRVTPSRGSVRVRSTGYCQFSNFLQGVLSGGGISLRGYVTDSFINSNGGGPQPLQNVHLASPLT